MDEGAEQAIGGMAIPYQRNAITLNGGTCTAVDCAGRDNDRRNFITTIVLATQTVEVLARFVETLHCNVSTMVHPHRFVPISHP